MTSNRGYKYFTHDTAGQTITKKQRADACYVGREILVPRLSNVDYLVLREREKIIRRWVESFPEERLIILDIGGSIQPYKNLFEPITEAYISADLQFSGLVDVIAHAEELPFKDKSIDLVLCTQMLGYVHSPHVAVDEMYRVLTRGGKLILSAPSFFPEHHDEIWRFLPSAYTYLLRHFSKVTIEPEGNSTIGLFRALNVAIHADIEGYRMMRAAKATSIPAINLLGLALSFLGKKNTRCTANYCVLAQK